MCKYIMNLHIYRDMCIRDSIAKSPIFCGVPFPYGAILFFQHLSFTSLFVPTTPTLKAIHSHA